MFIFILEYNDFNHLLNYFLSPDWLDFLFSLNGFDFLNK